MQSKRIYWARVNLALWLSVLVIMEAPALGKSGRDFAGFYDVKNVVDLGPEVQLTLSVRLHNFSDSDVSDATVTLQDSLLRQNTYGSFPSVSLRNRESVRLSGEFTIPRREYERWQRGAAPNLTIEFQDAAGITVRRRIELARRPLVEKE